VWSNLFSNTGHNITNKGVNPDASSSHKRQRDFSKIEIHVYEHGIGAGAGGGEVIARLMEIQ